MVSRDPRLDSLVHYLEDYAAIQRDEIERAARFARELPQHVELAIAPEIDIGVRDLGAIAKVASILAESGGGRTFLENAEAAFGLTPPAPPSRKAKSTRRHAAR